MPPGYVTKIRRWNSWRDRQGDERKPSGLYLSDRLYLEGCIGTTPRHCMSVGCDSSAVVTVVSGPGT